MESVRVVAGEGCAICNIQSPSTALEAKFSLRVAAAFALLDFDTSGLDTWARATEPNVIAMRDRVTVELVPGMSLSEADVAVRRLDGAELRRRADSGIPMLDKTAQSARVEEKFKALTVPVTGKDRSAQVLALLREFERQPDCRMLLQLCSSRGQGASTRISSHIGTPR